MAAGTIEERLAEVEEQVARLQRDKERANGTPWLDEWFGAFKDDPVYEEAMRLGREWRESHGFDDLSEEDINRSHPHDGAGNHAPRST